MKNNIYAMVVLRSAGILILHAFIGDQARAMYAAATSRRGNKSMSRRPDEDICYMVCNGKASSRGIRLRDHCNHYARVVLRSAGILILHVSIGDQAKAMNPAAAKSSWEHIHEWATRLW
ncbi:hypothetical protein J6590_006708 [Homalodisca vitripennis]|nr:hypothetical protein J6590_006708 [Homalodisca vitripennis]